MKRVILLTLALILIFTTCTFASPCPLPPANTEADIRLSGFEWYTDYQETLKTADVKGFKDSYEHIIDSSWDTPHWSIITEIANTFAGSEERCGGSVRYYDVPNVAGYKVKCLELFFILTPEIGTYSNYTEDNSCQYYLAQYSFDVTGTKSAYDDLVEKLKTIYGDNPYIGKHDVSEMDYTYWVNEEGACVGVKQGKYDLELVYVAPDSEEMLSKTEDWVRQSEIESEIENAKGDMSGL